MEMKRKGDEQGRKPKRRKLDKLVGWGEASELESIQQEGLEAWSDKVTTSTARVVQEVASESRLEQETLKMLMKETKIPEGRKTNEEPEKKFIFNTKGKITAKERKELQRTHKNIFEWV